MGKRLAKKILLVGWGSADWKFITPLIDAGKLPILKKLLETGSKGNLGVFDPPILSAAWTSCLTGKIPAKHQISSFTEIVENKAYPVSVHSRKAKALWNILSDHQMKVHQVGAWASHPAEAINGISISDWFVNSTKDDLPDTSIYPKEKKATFLPLLQQAETVSQEQVDAYLAGDLSGELSNSEAFKKQHPSHIQAIKSFIAQTASIQAAALEILENETWDQVSVFFNQMTNLTFRFMPYHIQHNTDIPKSIKAIYQKVLTVAYQNLDTYLGTLIDKAGEDASVLLVSQGGFLPDKKWINKLYKAYSTWEYNLPGILLFNGKPNIDKDSLFNITSMDIVPTILAFLGLPIAKDMDGRVIAAQKYFDKNLEVIESFENEHSTSTETSLGVLPSELLEKQLQDLGYATNSVYYLKELQSYLKTRPQIMLGQLQDAMPVLEDLWGRYPDNSWYGGRLAGCYFSLNQPEEGIELLDTVLDLGEEIMDLHLLKAQILIAQTKFRSASKEYDLVEKQIGQMPSVYNQIADGYLKMNQPQEAIKKFQLEIKNNPSPAIYFTMGMVFIQNKQNKRAIQPFEKAAELMPNHPATHFHLGNCYYQTQEYKKAADAFEIAKKYMPPDPKSQKQIQQMLIKLYRDHLDRPDKIKEMQMAYEKSIGSKGTITIVSGLPRSGTSMMMQMLVKAGLEPFTDGKREADENNQKGYYEHEAVKSLARDKQFLLQVDDKVIKIISHLLHHLPHVFKYKIIFMDRAIEEVMNSQHKMLGRLGKERGEDKENSLKLLKPFKESREKAIKWCENNKQFVDLLLIPYSEAINNPLEQAKRVKEFLGGTLDEIVMASVVDTSLYRERTKS